MIRSEILFARRIFERVPRMKRTSDGRTGPKCRREAIKWRDFPFKVRQSKSIVHFFKHSQLSQAIGLSIIPLKRGAKSNSFENTERVPPNFKMSGIVRAVCALREYSSQVTIPHHSLHKIEQIRDREAFYDFSKIPSIDYGSNDYCSNMHKPWLSEVW